ncbi:rab-GTPase-TBC domain-containing protein [Mortierella sp. GBAus27b]|nr:rab-GTPase-TBC domain-containing protein [Mortierella sp. GBAus27b]
MAQAKQYVSYRKSKTNTLAPGKTLRQRRPKTKDALEKEKRTRLLDEAIITGDIEALRKLSVTGPGFVNDGIRRRAWPLLLRTHVPRKETEVPSDGTPHKDEDQVRLDVIRSFTHLADTNSRQSVKRQRQDELFHVIMDVLKRHPKLAYYQGFHDVCTCLITVLGKEAAMPAAESIALFFFRDCMLDNLEPVLDQLSLMTALFRLEDPEVQDFLDRSSTLPFFPLSWVLTWCSHDLQDFGKIARIYDFLLCFNPLMSVYLTSAVVMSRHEELFEVECDNAMVHTFLAKFPQDIDLEQLISRAHELYMTYPPETLQNRAENWLDENSCVNTFNKPGLQLYDNNDEKVSSTPANFDPIDELLSKPRVKRLKESSALSKYPPNALHLYRRNMITMAAISAASMGTAALVLLNSALFREWLTNSGFL